MTTPGSSQKPQGPTIALYQLGPTNDLLSSFTGRRCVKHLRPQLDLGVIGTHDYDLAVKNWTTLSSLATGAALGLAMTSYSVSRYYNRLLMKSFAPSSRITQGVLRAMPPIMAIATFLPFHFILRAFENAVFCRSLEDPQAFSEAMSNIRRNNPRDHENLSRAGFILRDHAVMLASFSYDSDGFPVITRLASEHELPHSNSGQPHDSSSSPTPSKWDEVRRKSTQGKPSTWEAIRESEQRRKATGSRSEGSDPNRVGSSASAEWEAMLEVERSNGKGK